MEPCDSLLYLITDSFVLLLVMKKGREGKKK